MSLWDAELYLIHWARRHQKFIYEILKPKRLGQGPFIVTFDPLDGSSIIGSNWTVGSIIGIWRSDENILIG